MTYTAIARPAAQRWPSVGKQILFCDFDGPVADVSDRYYATYCTCLRRLQVATGAQHIHYLSQRQFWTFKQNRVPDRQIALWSGLAGSEIDRFLADVADQVNCPELLAYDRPQPLVREALEQLEQLQVRVVLVTLRSQPQVRQFLHAHNLSGSISDIYGASQRHAAYANRAEHKVDLLKTAIQQQRQQGYDPNGCFMVGDTEADILAGQAADLPTVALTCGIRSRRYLRGFGPTHLQTDLWTVVQRLVKPHFAMPQAG